MKRRAFITHSTLASAGSLLAASCNTKEPAKAVHDERTNESPDFELDEETISSLQEKMAAGKYTAETLAHLYLERISAIDKKGPALHAVIEINPEALSIAKAMDEERKAGKLRGPLHGIPVLIKDNIDTGDKMHTTAGALAMQDHIAKQDAFLVKQLRASGAVILGKTNLSEWANFRSAHSCSGWSSLGGQTKNPYVLDHNPCGSSSGSGVAVAANLCVVAVGTETDGSVTCPASVNGIVGLKPTVGLVSRSGIIPISATQDTAGPMGRTVKDVAILLGEMVGVDVGDMITKESEDKFKTDYTVFLDSNGLKGKRIGVEKKPQGDNQFMHALQQQAIEVLKKQGAEIIEINYIDELNKLGGAEFTVMQYEFKDGLNKYLASAGATMKTLADVIDFNQKNQDKAMRYFKQETLESSNKKAGAAGPRASVSALAPRSAAASPAWPPRCVAAPWAQAARAWAPARAAAWPSAAAPAAARCARGRQAATAATPSTAASSSRAHGAARGESARRPRSTPTTRAAARETRHSS